MGLRAGNYRVNSVGPDRGDEGGGDGGLPASKKFTEAHGPLQGVPLLLQGMGAPPAPPILGFNSVFLRAGSTVYPSHLSQGSPLRNSEPRQAPLDVSHVLSPSLVGVKPLGRAGWLERE